MTVKEFAEVLHNPDRVRIFRKEGEEKVLIFDGWAAFIKQDTGKTRIRQQDLERNVIDFRATPEITHKDYKKRGLMPPMDPDMTPMYSFSDLQMRLYYDIFAG